MGDVWLPDPEAVHAALETWVAGEVARRRGAKGVLLRGDPGPELCRWATEARPDLLVVPSPRPGRLRRALGGNPWAFLDRHAPCDVIAVEASGAWTWRVRLEGEQHAPFTATPSGLPCPA